MHYLIGQYDLLLICDDCNLVICDNLWTKNVWILFLFSFHFLFFAMFSELQLSNSLRAHVEPWKYLDMPSHTLWKTLRVDVSCFWLSDQIQTINKIYWLHTETYLLKKSCNMIGWEPFELNSRKRIFPDVRFAQEDRHQYQLLFKSIWSWE